MQLRAEERFRIERIAKSFCKACKVKSECLEYATVNYDKITGGVWGGKTFKELKRLQRKRTREAK